ncbi:MAG: hypothetical protein ABJN65_01990 [Parasphingorhabdus sp.]
MSNIILHITAGKGPKECHWVVSRLAETFAKEANTLGLSCEIVDGEKEASASLLLSLAGKGCEAFAAERTGSIRWIGQSPFRPKHRRKNWYVGVKPAPSNRKIFDIAGSTISICQQRNCPIEAGFDI